MLSLKGRPSLNLHIRELIDSLALAAGWGKWSLRVWLSVKGGQAGRLNGHRELGCTSGISRSNTGC